MKGYIESVKLNMKSWKVIPIVLATIARLYYGYKWINSGWHKLTWLTDGELNSFGYVSRMVENMRTDYGDPFKIGRLFAEIADNVFLRFPQLTDVLVVVFEICIGLAIILGFKLIWTMLLALFLNLQFFAAGSTNNFGYVITNLVILKWHKYFEIIGLEGYLRFKKGEDLL